MRYVVKTLGCKANLYDSQLIEAEFRKNGWTSVDSAGSDSTEEQVVCVVNSCTVTDDAEKESRRAAARLAKKYPGAKVVMTGCSAEVNPHALLETRGVDFVIANRDKPKFVDLVGSAVTGGASHGILGAAEGYDELKSRHPMDREWPLPEELTFNPSSLRSSTSTTSVDGRPATSARTRAFLKIQEGCDAFCTYCIIPYGRGPNRSLRPGDILRQVSELVDQGVREIVLTGTNIGQYGYDWATAEGAETSGSRLAKGHLQLESLCRAILERTGLERLRVSSLDPVEITQGLTDLMVEDPRFCPHFHVSLQSPDSRVLRLMKRKYGASDVSECLNRIALAGSGFRPFVGMDLITGFPGESEEDFKGTLDALAALPWTRLHVFPFSEREGTPATRLPGSVPMAERKRRSRVLNDMSLKRLVQSYEAELQAIREFSDGVMDGVLIEGPARGPDGTRNWLAGYSRNYLRVLIPLDADAESKINTVVGVRPETITLDRAAGDAVFLASLT